MIELADFEDLAIQAKENETADLIDRIHLADFAVDHDYLYRNENPPPRLACWLAHLWGQATVHSVNVLARMAEVFNDEDILPNAPLSLYKAVMETDDPHYALRLATDSEFRRQELGEEFAANDRGGYWSSREVRNHFDILKGRHLSSTAFRGHRVRVTEWDVLTGRAAFEGLPLSGEKPKEADVTVREVLKESSNERVRNKRDPASTQSRT